MTDSQSNLVLDREDDRHDGWLTLQSLYAQISVLLFEDPEHEAFAKLRWPKPYDPVMLASAMTWKVLENLSEFATLDTSDQAHPCNLAQYLRPRDTHLLAKYLRPRDARLLAQYLRPRDTRILAQYLRPQDTRLPGKWRSENDYVALSDGRLGSSSGDNKLHGKPSMEPRINRPILLSQREVATRARELGITDAFDWVKDAGPTHTVAAEERAFRDGADYIEKNGHDGLKRDTLRKLVATDISQTAWNRRVWSRLTKEYPDLARPGRKRSEEESKHEGD